MNESPRFVQEIVDWASTLPVARISLLKSDVDTWVLHLVSTSGIDLHVYLLPIIHASTVRPLLDEARTKSIRHVALWEDLWYTKRAIVQSRLAAILGISERIPARLTQVRRLDRPTTLKFLQENHLQDAVLAKFKYGLFLPKKHYRVLHNPPEADEWLVAVATFAHPRLFVRNGRSHRSFELVRFANVLNSTVVGGLDKLISHLIKEHQPDDLMTYADLEWSDGHSYLKLGFESISDIPPQLFWVNPKTMERCSPHRLPTGLTEPTALEQGFVKIHNAGSRKFVKVFTLTT